MPTDNTPDTMVDGGTPTDEEARLAQELEDEAAAAAAGEPADRAGDDRADDGAGKDGAAAAADADEAGDGKGDDGADAADDAAAADAAQAEAPDPAQAPAAVATAQPEEPKPPRDFEAAYTENQRKFDDGEIEAGEFQKTLRDISREEAGHVARVEIFKEHQQSAAQRAQAEFNNAASAWEAQHKDFMSNPLRAKAMQDAIEAVDKQTPGLSPADLLAAAQKAAFEVYNYTPPEPATPADARKAVADAAAARKPVAVPQTLGGTPTAAHVDASGGSAFANLDALDIDSLENKVAMMTDAQLEAYLADAPGAKANGQRGTDGRVR